MVLMKTDCDIVTESLLYILKVLAFISVGNILHKHKFELLLLKAMCVLDFLNIGEPNNNAFEHF